MALLEGIENGRGYENYVSQERGILHSEGKCVFTVSLVSPRSLWVSTAFLMSLPQHQFSFTP
jgi:hypothetical protein